MVDWAPLNVPWERRVQTLAAFYYIVIFLLSPFISLFITIYLTFYAIYWWWLLIPYFCWMYYGRDIASRGGRPSESWRNQAVWRHFADYFPIKLVKTADLPTDRNYIIGNHPHGIMSIGSFASFCTNGTGFNSLFPGIKRHLCTLPQQFFFPFRRELILQSGVISSSAESISYVLSQEDKGHAVCIVLGGAEEALDAHADNYDLKLGTRRGFVRLAIQHGASLVPVYHFGENRIYYQADNRRGTRLRAFQSAFKRWLGFSPPIFYGRGVFNYSFGFIPYRLPITSVVGPPIEVKKNPEPTKEEIAEVHAEYCRQLVELFEEHKTKYGVPADAKLNIY